MKPIIMIFIGSFCCISLFGQRSLYPPPVDGLSGHSRLMVGHGSNLVIEANTLGWWKRSLSSEERSDANNFYSSISSQPKVELSGYRYLVKNYEYFLKMDSASKDTTNFMSKLNGINDFMEHFVKVAPIPFASYTTETSWILGLSKFNAFKMRDHDDTDTITQASGVTGLAYYTLKDQYKFTAKADLMLPKNKYIWRTLFLYQKFPLFYYGIGNDTKIEDQRTLLSSDIQVSTQFMFKVYKKIYAGLKYDFYDYFEVELDTLLPGDSIHLVHNIGIQSGLGGAVEIEQRDNRLNAKKGYYLNTHFQLYRKFLGSEYEFNHFLFDLRYYTTPFKSLTIAAQLYTENKQGDVPIQSLTMIGGSERLRGVYEGRYRDNALLESQVELRFPLFWIFGGVAFAGIGQNMPDYNKLAFDQMHFAYGGGFRLKVDSEHDVNLRFDVARSSDQTTFFMGFSEAF